MAPTTVLFDLDGTLLPLNGDQFMKLYFQELAPVFADQLNPKALARLVLESLGDMVADLSPRTNERVFMESMARRSGLAESLLRERFEEYYGQRFARVQAASSVSPTMQAAVRLLRAQGIPLVLATNPIFPRPAVLQRLAWGGLDPADFVYISTFESSSACKPNLAYYRELLERVGARASDCLMVGNDRVEDLAVTELGMPTYLVTDWELPRAESRYQPTYQGSAQDFSVFLQNGFSA